VRSLTARSPTTGEVAAFFAYWESLPLAGDYGGGVSENTISRITEKVRGQMAEWVTRRLDRVYPVSLPDDAAGPKCLYLVTLSLDPTGRGRARWVIRWRAARNALAITFDWRINPSINSDARSHSQIALAPKIGQSRCATRVLRP